MGMGYSMVLWSQLCQVWVCIMALLGCGVSGVWGVQGFWEQMQLKLQKSFKLSS
jgi:hypothetical protein